MQIYAAPWLPKDVNNKTALISKNRSVKPNCCSLHQLRPSNLPYHRNEQRDLTPYVYTHSTFPHGTCGYYIPMSIIVAWFPDDFEVFEVSIGQKPSANNAFYIMSGHCLKDNDNVIPPAHRHIYSVDHGVKSSCKYNDFLSNSAIFRLFMLTTKAHRELQRGLQLSMCFRRYFCI